MIKPDLIVSWPRNCDYPLWRQNIRDYRDRYEKIIISFTETNAGDDYRQFIKGAMAEDNCIFIDPITFSGTDDWRNVSVNEALKYSTAQWVFFTEQDFYFLNGFWVDGDMANALGVDAIIIKQGERIHPACLFIRRPVLDKTSKFFGIVTNVGDHFCRIQKDLEEMNINMWTIPENKYIHLNGLSHNLRLVYEGQKPCYQAEIFYEYLRQSIEVDVPIDDRYKKLVFDALRE